MPSLAARELNALKRITIFQQWDTLLVNGSGSLAMDEIHSLHVSHLHFLAVHALTGALCSSHESESPQSLCCQKSRARRTDGLE
jgi:hypothetical protein